MMTYPIKEGLFDDADSVFSTMEKTGYAPNPRLLNHVVRVITGER
jgi:pentatricopeptide repeat protein